MSGHSKWNNIKRKKEKTDGAKAKVFTKMAREIAVAVKEGGAEPASNGKLRDIIAKAKSLNVPTDNIFRVIKKAGDSDRAEYEAIMYEGYGPRGIAVMVDTLTDNRNRTASNLRHYFDKFGGNLGATGCVGFLFEERGVLLIPMAGKEEDQLMEDVFEAGADDYSVEEEMAEVLTKPESFRAVREFLEQKGYAFESADVAYVPSATTALTDADDLKNMSNLLAALDDDDDVQDYWHTLENEEDLP